MTGIPSIYEPFFMHDNTFDQQFSAAADDNARKKIVTEAVRTLIDDSDAVSLKPSGITIREDGVFEKWERRASELGLLLA